MTTAYITLSNIEQPVGKGALKGNRLPYISKDGIPVFFFQGDYSTGTQVIAPPGMVGVSATGDTSYVVNADGDAVLLPFNLRPTERQDAKDARARYWGTVKDNRLGWVPRFDEQSRNYNVKSLLSISEIYSHTWRLDIRLDQGNTSACTGFSRTHDLAAYPKPLKIASGSPFDYNFAYSLYRLAQHYDEWSGENYEGSSVLGAFKAAQKLGFIGEYRWAFSIEDYLAAICSIGSGVSGTSWFNSMFDPLPTGEIIVDKSSGVAGGHAYLIRGVVATETGKKRIVGVKRNRSGIRLMRITNNWSAQWGVNGDAFIWEDDYAEFLMPDGEQAISTVAFHR